MNGCHVQCERARERENIKKNILKEYLFGFPDNWPWPSVITSGLVL